MNSSQNCTLCQLPIKKQKIFHEQNLFCCMGCQTVYQILATQSKLDNFREQPLYQQALKFGLISNPDLIEEMKNTTQEHLSEDEFRSLHLEILELWCPSCAQVIELVLQREKGVRKCLVDYVTDLGIIEFTPRYITEEKIFSTIKKLGYIPSLLKDPRQTTVSRSLYLRFIIASFFSLNIMMFSYPIYASYFDQDFNEYAHLFAWLSFISSLPVLTYSAWPIWQRFYHSAKVGIWGMEALVAVGTTAATVLSLYELLKGGLLIYFDSMSVLIAFVLLGKIIESKAKFSAKDSLIQLSRGLPKKGRKSFSDGSWGFVPLKELTISDHFITLKGEKIVLDGVVIQGEGACDESLMTGESLPIMKKKGDLVLAGTLLQQGNLTISVTSTSEETALKRIIGMVEQDIHQKVHYTRSIDTIVKWFVPVVFTLAAFTGIYTYLLNRNFQDALIRTVSLILISCPCAIGIAVPLAEAYVLNGLAKMGIIIRNRGCLRYLGHETVIVFDKTGTVTEGKFSVLSGLEKLTKEELSLLKGMVIKSIHPIAISLQNALTAVSASQLDDVEEIVGKGMIGTNAKNILYLGSASFLKEHHLQIQSGPPLNTGIYTPIYLSINNRVFPLLLGDKIKKGIKNLLAAFVNVHKKILSGDHPTCVEFVAKELRFDSWHGHHHPLQKRDLIEKLRKENEIVAMIGDGINDAPSLTAAHIGIAVISATDISIQVSDILLTTPQLNNLIPARQLNLFGQKIARQNLFWAFFYNCVGMGLAMIGLLTPLFAAFAMVMSSLIVLGNTFRIRYFLIADKKLKIGIKN